MEMLLKDTISLTSILEQLPRGLIRSSAAEGAPKDRLRVGWRVENGSELSVVIGSVTGVTPEAAVTLSALVDAVRHTRGSAASVRIDPLATDDSTSRAWINAVLLNQLVSDHWNDQPSLTPTKINTCTVSPLWRMSLKSGDDCDIRATFLAGSLAQHLVRKRTDDVEHLLIAVSNALREALRNTLEHGHDAPGVCNAYAHMMVAPVQYWASVAAADIASEAERQWLREFPPETPVLELAIADAGKGIPSTLHSAYARRDQRQRDASRERAQDSRLYAQREICKWALDYRSTRKRTSDFPTRSAQLNWRGLHRTLNAVARVGGTLLIRSGSTRVGTAFINRSAQEIAGYWERASDLPGTALVVRVPLLSDQKSLKGRSAGSLSSVVKRNLVLRPKVVAVQDLPTDATAHRAKRLAIVHSFDTLSDTVALVPIVYALPPSGVSVHLFVQFSAPAGSGDLQAFTSAAKAAAFGVPRLVGLRRGSAIRWIFAGLIPDGLRAAIDDLESTGIVRPNWADDVARDFFRELLSAYPSALKRDNEFVHLAVFGARLGTDVFLAALQLAFDNWASHNIGPCIFEQPSVAVRTPKGGRLVRRYLPLLRILYANETLSEAIGECLARLLELEAREHGSVLVVADSEASYFIARLLLSTDHPDIQIYLRRPPLDPAGGAIVVFSDVVWKGEALKAIVDEVKPTRIVIALDLSPDLHPHGFSKVSSLLRYPFDPRELATPVADMSIVEVDKVTHLPAPPLYADATSFGFGPTQDEFARTHPDVFTNGIQTRGGRIHTLAVSTKRLVEGYSSELLAWVMRTIEDILPKTPDLDIVIATRAEAHVSRLIAPVAEQVMQAAAPGTRVFHVSIPFAASASHEVFGRPTRDPWDGATEVRARSLLPNELRKHPLVIFLDDACVTGRTLRQFLLRVAGAAHDATPSSVLLLPIVSRFATDEELFFGALCRNIASLDGTRQVPVLFRPCLRLFVRSYDRVEALHAYRLLIKAQRQLAGLDERLERFVDKALGRLREAASTTTDADTAANGHPFYGASAVSDGRNTSARAVKIRHLLSLHDANVGVLGQALTEIMAVSAEEDWSFLSVLATEPDLLDRRPLKGQCEHDIKSLAISALTHDAPPAVQSDAIAVLAAQGTLVGALVTVVPAILSNTDLVDECVALLAATATAPARTWRALLEAATNSHTVSLRTDAGRADEAAYLMSVARSLLLVEQTIGTQQTESDYTGQVQRYIADTSYHGPTVRAMAAVTNFLESSDSTRKMRTGRHVKTLVGNFCTAGTRVLVPGLLGISSLAQAKCQPAAHRDLRMAAIRLSTALTELNTLLESVAEFDSATIHRLTILWKRIQTYSQRSPTEFVLSHANLSDRDSTPAERWLPEFFCLPIETIGNMAKETVDGLNVTSGPIAEGRQFSVIVAPVPLNEVRRIADLLLIDVQRHGLDKSASVEFELKAAEGVPCLEVTIRDAVREGDIPGRHRSQGQVRDIAHRNGVHYFHDPPRSPGELFASRLVFPNVWYLEG